MTPADLDAFVARTGHEHLRFLTSEANTDARSREAYRRIVRVDAAGGAPPDYPPLRTQVASAVEAASRFVASGLALAPDAVYETRIEICRGCELYDAAQKRCRQCGCFTELKLRSASESCPHPSGAKWSAVPPG